MSNFSDSNSVKHLEKVASKTSKWVGQEFSEGINLIIQIKVFYVWNINPKVHQRFLLKIIKIRFEKIMKQAWTLLAINNEILNNKVPIRIYKNENALGNF